MALPEHIGIANAGQIREQLLSLINRGAAALIADMTATVSCDQAGADAMFRAFQRASASGSELRLVVTARLVARVLAVTGLDRLVSIYPSLEAAAAASAAPAASLAPVLAPVLAAAPAALVLADGDGTVAAVSRELEDLFAYGHGELNGRPIESLMPDGLQVAAPGSPLAWSQRPGARPMSAGGPLAGLRKDGTAFPVRVSLSPVATTAGHYTLVMIRAVTRPRRAGPPAAFDRDADMAERDYRDLLGTVISGLYRAGLSLQASLDVPADAAGPRVTAVLADLDGMISGVRDSVVAIRERAAAPPGETRHAG